MPRDLIYGNSGLCIELAQLWCALGQAAGLKVHLIMVPGHAYPYLQANDGTATPIEATWIHGNFGGNRGKAETWEEAIQKGREEFYGTATTQGDKDKPTTEALDIRDLQSHGIRPPELPEINVPELVKQLDDRLAKRRPAGPRVTNRVTNIIVVRQAPRYCATCPPRPAPRYCLWCKPRVR
jgi:hypothetical protein